MEKLSIEEKAKAYDKGLERAQALYNDKNEIGYANAESVLEEVFPLLKESEDEKTERILHSISSKISFHLRDIFTEEEFQCFDTWSNAWLEKQGKGKLTDKSKFKVGDWCIDNEDGTIFQIVKVFNDTYNYKTNEGKKYCCSHYSLENDARLWTIADAKDGDVLTNGDFPCIFKRCDGNGSLYVYCGINAHNDFSILSEDPENVWDDYSKQYFPATKEQRDTFFAKMKESGYEWLEETKELKKIEQKPTQETEPFEAEHGKYYYCIKDYFCGGRKQASKGDVVQALRGLPIMGLKDASEYFMPVNFIKCNFAWSEEDEEHYKACLQYFDAVNPDMVYYKDYQWLKSLKHRIGG